MIDRVSEMSAGIAGQGYVWTADDIPVYMTGRVMIVSPERNFCCSSSEDKGNGTILAFSSNRLGMLHFLVKACWYKYLPVY
jgi:hypothetical protein